MKERPILFNGEMVRAVLDGRKTQTRRVIKPQPKNVRGAGGADCTERYTWDGVVHFSEFPSWASEYALSVCPYGKVGDRLWIRETFATTEQAGDKPEDAEIIYRATDPDWHDDFSGWKWKPCIFMPRAFSRITLEIVSIRVERVQDISERDAKAEGISETTTELGARYCFGSLWNSINEKRGFGWDINPWVWVVEFKRVGEGE